MVSRNQNPAKMKVRSGDLVQVVSGKDRGKRAKVERAIPREHRVVVEGVQMVRRHVKSTPGKRGGLIDAPRPIPASKVMVVCPVCERPTRIGHTERDGKKVRICKKCDEVVSYESS